MLYEVITPYAYSPSDCRADAAILLEQRALVGRLGDVAAVVPDSLRHLVDRITEGLEAETREVIETASYNFV